MKESIMEKQPVLVAGNNNLAFSIAVCLLNAGSPVNLLTCYPDEATACVNDHLSDMKQENLYSSSASECFVAAESMDAFEACTMAIIITAEDLHAKKQLIRRIEERVPGEMIIAINTESISLDEIQEDAKHPRRIIGMNWTEPVHTTRFLEV